MGRGPAIRASDAEREAVAARLRTRHELVPLVAWAVALVVKRRPRVTA